MNHKLADYILAIIVHLVRIQNEQLVKIICKDQCIKYELLQHLVISPYEIKKYMNSYENKII